MQDLRVSPFYRDAFADPYWAERVMRSILIVLLIILCATELLAAEVPFTVIWDAVTKKLDGKPDTPTDYKIYACNSGITKTPWASGSVSCSGAIQTYIATDITFSGVYSSPTNSGVVNFYVAARDAAGNESPLSNLAILRYNTLSLTFQPPANFKAPGG